MVIELRRGIHTTVIFLGHAVRLSILFFLRQVSREFELVKHMYL